MYCTRCGKELWENARFCHACGTPVVGAEPSSIVTPPPIEEPKTTLPDEQALFEEERAFVVRCCRTLNRERLAWKTVGIVLLVRAILMMFLAVFTAVSSHESEWLLGASSLAVSDGLISLVIAAVNLWAAKKMRTLCALGYTDIRPLVDRYSGSSAIVFSAVFNLIAMFFVIDSVNKIKSQTAVLERIVQRQQAPQI